MYHPPPWMCNGPDCRFRNRLLEDASLTTPHICPTGPPVPIFVNPFPPPKPITILPPPPLAPAPPGSFFFPPPMPPPDFSMPGPSFPMMPPAPEPPGPFMLPPPLQAPLIALPAPPPPPPQEAEQKPSPPRSSASKKSPSIRSIVLDKNVQTYKAKKGPTSREDKEALCDFEERTRRQDYRNLALSSKSSQHKSHGTPEKKVPSAPRSIMTHDHAQTSAAVNQQVYVNVYNTGHGSKSERKIDHTSSSRSPKSIPAKTAASVREDAIKRAHSLAHSIAATAAGPAAMMSGALKPASQAGSHASKPAPSHASKAATAQPAPSHAPSKHTSHASTAKASSHTHKSKSSKAKAKPTSSHHGHVAVTTAMVNTQVRPTSIESWRKGVKAPVRGA